MNLYYIKNRQGKILINPCTYIECARWKVLNYKDGYDENEGYVTALSDKIIWC